MVDRTKVIFPASYSQIEPLAEEGGMSWLYHARWQEREVCLKLLSPQILESISSPTEQVVLLRRFDQEREQLFALHHPHIVAGLDRGGNICWPGLSLPFYSMEYCAGGSLRGKLRERRKLPLSEALGIARKIAAALGYFHEQTHNVHRDVKPENILFVGPEPKLADFGLVKNYASHITEDGIVPGTAEYVAPEQELGEAVDQRADIYSLGVVLYEMLTGEKFALQERRAALSLLKGNPSLWSLCYRMVAALPNRFSTMQEVVQVIADTENQRVVVPYWFGWVRFWQERRDRWHNRALRALAAQRRSIRHSLSILHKSLQDCEKIPAAQLIPALANELQFHFQNMPPHLVAREFPSLLESLTLPQLKLFVSGLAQGFPPSRFLALLHHLPLTPCPASPTLLILGFLSDSTDYKRWVIVRQKMKGLWTSEQLEALWNLANKSDQLGSARVAQVVQLSQVSQAAPAAVVALLCALQDSAEEVRKAAAQALGKIGKPVEIAMTELSLMLDKGDWHLRKLVIEVLAQIGLAALPALQTAMQNRDWWVRKIAVEVLGSLGAEGIAALRQALRDSESTVRKTTAQALQAQGWKAADAEEEGWSVVALQAWEQAVSLGAAAVPALCQALADRDWRIRDCAARALGEIGPAAHGAVPALMTALTDLERDVRQTAQQAIEQIDVAALPELLRGLKKR